MTPIKFFAFLIQKAGTSEVKLDLSNCKTVADVRQLVSKEIPAIAQDMNKCMIAVNMEFQTDSTALTDVSEIAIIPPVSGG
ncbi:molybdopterin converting factor subunit 1 [Listeria booriae]|uniref:molybdopterin converting factor subunit 1 n=1 Tax=Listeria booriae TaxID=1552123 RepID=UPI001629194B|nr:molybdopterin converting factor subunit 1 [Listeria booriae]MBC2020224.1 molybdopterin converting factor subunit 1 [Listeria booriae]MBC2047261.1 molybdopterin converting factor subunit 1 [Listeria booriae]MBC2077796.1 molybdopterin converting factor subunit 1 [Listeria booriae]MBC2171480.1 molybdopterin converting factor subunit 1 [Listeria booriae]